MSTRTIATLISVVLLAGMALAAGGTAPVKPPKRTHDMTVQVVSFDMKAKTITIKDEQGQTKTAPVIGIGIRQLRRVRAGEMFTLTCQDNAKGEHLGISAIKEAKPAAAPAPK